MPDIPTSRTRRHFTLALTSLAGCVLTAGAFMERHTLKEIGADAIGAGIYKLRGGPAWQRVARAAAFPPRDEASIFQLGGRAFLCNGYVYGGTTLRDIWSSADGVTWDCVNASPQYESNSLVTPLGNALYAVGTKLHKSVDGGFTWMQVLESLPFTNDECAFLAVRGVLTAIASDFVWVYDERANAWSKAGSVPGAPRFGAKAVMFRDELFLVGGFDRNSPPPRLENGYRDYKTKNDVHKSNDGGATWILCTPNLPCPPRMWPSLCVHNGQMYLMAGYDNVSGTRNFNDSYSSPDGVNWTLLVATHTFSERHGAAAYALNGQLYLASGNANPNGINMNDIWKLEA